MGLVPDPPGKVVSGEILYNGEDLLKKSNAELRKIRGGEISMIFQDPMTALNPVLRVGDQIAEVIHLHGNCSRTEALKRAMDMLQKVGIPPERVSDYPHQFSGGMKQRVVIAIALACTPQLIIADEPTTALDVTIQAQVLDMMNDLKQQIGTSMILITHDLGVVAANADRLAVMYAGQVVESGTADQIFYHCAQPYTRGLLESIPRLNAAHDARLTYIGGTPPDALNPAPGCAFSARCKYAMRICRQQAPEKREVQPGHFCSCFLMDDEAEDTRKKTGWEVSL